MASLRRSSTGIFSLIFRYPPARSGQQFTRSLATTDETEAKQVKVVVERTLKHTQEGVLQLPTQPNADEIWQFLRSSGRTTKLPDITGRLTLANAVSRYLSAEFLGSKEPETLRTELRHTNNLRRHFKDSTWLDRIGPSELRTYIEKRKQEKGIRGGKIKNDTIRKELQTFRQLWDFAASEGFILADNPVSLIKLPKRNRKPPFQTWEQIQTKVDRGGLTEYQIAEAWDCLFLRESETSEFLKHVEAAAKERRFPFIYPALVFCALTGARRSEMFRAEIDDVQIGSGGGTDFVRLREKKRDKDSDITFREVPIHPRLKSILGDYLRSHPGGQRLFVKDNGNPLEDRTSRDAFEAVTRKSKWTVLRGYHILRHSFASNLARHGVSEHRIKEYMGHGTEEMARRYRHLFPEDKHEDINKLDF